MARKTQDPDNSELHGVLVTLLEDNVDITAREVARRHSSFSSASTITRQPERRVLLEQYQERQTQMRAWQNRVGKKSKEQIADVLTVQEAKIDKLDKSVRALVAGHVALIAAVAQVGGMSKLSKFYASFRDVRIQLSELGALPHDSIAPEPSNLSDFRTAPKPTD